MYKSHMGYSHIYGPFLVVDYVTASIISGYQRRTLILGSTHMVDLSESERCSRRTCHCLGAVSYHKALTKVRGNVRVYACPDNLLAEC